MNIDDMATIINETAHQHGFYVDDDGNRVDRNFGEVIALMHSELSEALEEHRSGHQVVYTVGGKPEGAAIELVDCGIRILDTLFEMLKGTDYTIEELFRMKMEYNDGRPYKHGRKY